MNDKPYQVIKYSLIKMGRGGAVVKISARNLETGGVEERSLSSNINVEEVNTYRKKLQFLYQDSANAFFMDGQTYEQVEISLSVLKDQIVFIKEGDIIDILFWDSKPLSVELPPKVTLKVIETDPGVKGNSATNIYKPAKLENGLLTKVPLFIKVGESVRIDTRSGEYLERAN